MAKTAKVTAEGQEVPNPEDCKGYECLTPVYKLRPSKAAALIASVDDEASRSEQVAQMIEAVEKYAVEDEEGWSKLFQEDGVKGVLELAMAYLVKLVGANG